MRAHRHLPYTVLREKINIPLASSTTASSPIALVVQPLLSTASRSFAGSDGGLSTTVAYWNTGSSTMVSGSLAQSSLLASNTNARIRLHRIAAEFCCTGTAATTGVPDGLCYFGVLRTPCDPGALGTASNAYNYFATREEVQQRASLSLQYQPIRLVSYPLDPLSYQTFLPCTGFTDYATQVASSNAMAPIVIGIPTTVSACNFAVTLHIEWTVQYDSDAVLQSTARMHPGHDDETWASAIEDAIGGAGIVAAVRTAAERLGGAGGGGLAQRGMQGLARRALPALLP